jgi:hypothetical protein
MTRLAQIVKVSSVLLEIGNGSPHMTDIDIEAIDYFRDEAVALNPFPYLDSLVRDQPVWIEPRYGVRTAERAQAHGALELPAPGRQGDASTVPDWDSDGLGSHARPSDRS